MKLRSIVKISLLTVIFLVSCAPTAAPAPVEPEVPLQPASTKNELPAPTSSAPTVAPAETQSTEEPSDVPQAVATSRGPNLEATNPTTISLDSGELQLVEFFRYT